MTIEEINKWLDNEYGVSYTRLEELHDFYFEKYCDLQQENQELKNGINKLQKENEKLHSYKPLYQNLKMQKEELRSWLEEKIQYIDTIYLGTDRKNYSDDTILDMSSRKWGYKDTLNKLEELEGVNSESKRDV